MEHPETHYADDSWFQAVGLSALVVGSFTASGLGETKPILFSLFALALVAGHWLGKSLRTWQQLTRETKPIRVSKSLRDLEETVNKESLAKDRQRNIQTLITAGSASLVLGIPVTLVVLNYDAVACGSLLLVSLLCFLRRYTIPSSVNSVLCHSAVSIIILPLTALLGVYSQIENISSPTAILGFVPGSFLAASVVAKFTTLLESLGWTRKLIVQKRGLDKVRPGRIMQLYSVLLLTGPISVFVAVPAGLLPPSLMIGIMPLIWATKVASGFSEGTLSANQTAERTTRLALVSSGLMLVAGYLARG